MFYIIYVITSDVTILKHILKYILTHYKDLMLHTTYTHI